MAQPLLRQLHQQNPLSPIDVLAPKWVAPVLGFMKEIRQIIQTDLRHGELRLKNRWHIAKQLRANNYRKAYVLPNSLKSALIPWLAGITQRIAWRGEHRYLLINKRYIQTKDTPTPLTERFAYLAEGQRVKITEPRLHVSHHLHQQTIQKFAANVCENPLVLAVGVEYGPARRWPPQYFAAVAKYWLNNKGVVWILGTKKDRVHGRLIRESLEVNLQTRCLNLCGQTTIEEAIALIAGASHVVSNDSGLMHVSAALQRPLIAVFGSTPMTHILPLNSDTTMVSMRMSCAPCMQRICPLEHTNCLTRISPQFVIQLLSDSC